LCAAVAMTAGTGMGPPDIVERIEGPIPIFDFESCENQARPLS